MALIRRDLAAAGASALAMALGFPLFIGTFPVFIGPVSQAFGWGAKVYPQSLLTVAITTAIAAPLIGQLIDRIGARTVVIVGLVAWAAEIFVLSLLSGSEAQLLSLSIVMGITAAAAGPVAYSRIVATWFDRHLALALALVLSAAPSLGAALLVSSAARLIPAFGWRAAYRLLAALVLVLAVPAALAWIRESRRLATEGEEERPADEGASLGAAARSRDFWVIILVTCLICGVIQGIVVHFVAIASERGVEATRAALALSAFSLAAPIGPALAGALADRAGPRVLAIFYAAPVISLILFLDANTPIAAMIGLGLGFSAAMGMLPYLLTRFFGLRHSSQLVGVGLGAASISISAGSVLVGAMRDRLGSFAPMLPMLLLVLGGAFFLSLALRGPVANPLSRR
jgi:MFS family permease